MTKAKTNRPFGSRSRQLSVVARILRALLVVGAVVGGT
jgi:hypothetical protein